MVSQSLPPPCVDGGYTSLLLVHELTDAGPNSVRITERPVRLCGSSHEPPIIGYDDLQLSSVGETWRVERNIGSTVY